MLKVPPELTFSKPGNAEEFLDVVTDRNEMRITYPITELHNDERFSVVLNTTNFVDLRSVKMFASLQVSSQGLNVRSWSNPFLFESITLKTEQGIVLEHLDQAHLISTLARKVGRSKDDEETVLGNSLLSNFNVNNLSANTAPVEIPAFNLLGFFNLRKVLRLSSLGALVIDFKLSNANELYQSKSNEGRINYYNTDLLFQLNNMFILYDEVQVSESYLAKYISEYEQGKMTLTMNTIAHSRDVIKGLAGEKTIRIHRSANKVKTILTTVTPYGSDRRMDDKNNFGCNSYIPPYSHDNMYYQYKLSGQSYPSLGVRSTAQAYKHYQDCFYLNYGRKQINDITYSDFISSPACRYAFKFKDPENPAVSLDSYTFTNGHHILGTSKTNVSLDSNSGYLTVTLPAPAAPYVASDYLQSVIWNLPITDNTVVDTSGASNIPRDVWTPMEVNGLNCLVRELNFPTVAYQLDDGTEVPAAIQKSLQCVFEKYVSLLDIFGSEAYSTTVGVYNIPQRFTLAFYQANDNVGSFMMCYSLNSVLNPMSRNYGSVDASNAQLSFNFGTALSSTYAAAMEEKRYNVDTYMFHEQTIHIREGDVSVSN
jgi:hypothetical protein